MTKAVIFLRSIFFLSRDGVELESSKVASEKFLGAPFFKFLMALKAVLKENLFGAEGHLEYPLLRHLVGSPNSCPSIPLFLGNLSLVLRFGGPLRTSIPMTFIGNFRSMKSSSLKPLMCSQKKDI